MKEYKVVHPKLGFRNRSQNFEDLLNQYGSEFTRDLFAKAPCTHIHAYAMFAVIDRKHTLI